MAMRQIRGSFLFLGLICLCSSAFAGVRPSFSLDYSTVHATDIVLVETTATDGLFEVVESWKGSLLLGERISIPALRPLKSAIPISSYSKSWPFHGAGAEDVPRQPVGSRMVLFLARTTAGQLPNDSAQAVEWKPSNLLGSMKASVVWVDDGELYCFVQSINPGPSTLSPCNYSEDELRRRFAEVDALNEGLEEVLAVEDGAARAERLKDYVRSEVFEIRFSALKELRKCGPAAVPTIKGMLEDSDFIDERAELIEILADTGGVSVGPELHKLLKEELAFWKSVAPSLSQDWWNQDVTPHAPLPERYGETYQLIIALAHIHYLPARDTAKELRAFWRSQPQLNDASGIDQIAEECDKLIADSQGNLK
jgi:hypothetical protein